MAEQSVVQETNVIAVPEDLAANHILALGNYVTSYFALHTRARLQPGETVLVHGAAGGIGSSATQLALVAGCRVLATERGADRVKLCRGLGADLVVDTDDDDFVAAVNEATLSHGVDLVIDPVGGDIFDLTRRCIAFGGRIVVVGFTSGRIPELRVNHLILRNFGVMGVNAAAYVFDPRHRHFYDQARNELLQMCRQGDVSPVIHGESPLEMLVDVLADLDRGAVLGKAVIRPSSTATTPRSGQ